MDQQFKSEHAAPNIAARMLIVAIFAGWMLSGCQVAQQIGLLPKPTSTPDVPATQAAQAAKQTADAQASATAQAQATSTAQAVASATALAQSQATSTAQRAATQTAQAQQTAAAISTVQAIDVYADALFKSSNKAYGPAEGVLEQKQSNTIAIASSGTYLRNFIIEVRFSNPADRAIHPWDVGFLFRTPPSGRCSPGYRLELNSDQTFDSDVATGKTLPNQTCEIKSLSRGSLTNMDVSTTGSNLVRLIVNDKSALLYLNGKYQFTLDTSDVNAAGDLLIGSGFSIAHEFPGLACRYTNFVVSSLP